MTEIWEIVYDGVTGVTGPVCDGDAGAIVFGSESATSRHLGSGNSRERVSRKPRAAPDLCQECEHLVDRGLDYAPLCELLKDGLVKSPCAGKFQAALASGKHPDPACPWNQKT